ncbi:LysR substrate-binding domain-containing protein [Orrella sp. JC864]|uniref:LysR family transcriptional regulator n=1 Tax=Orrella sp. JC864 TaxID=3120298 RepID=UPI003008FA31
MAAVLDIDLLRTFHAVARLGQFRAAAEHVHKSPAAISVHIQRLESLAGGRLFDRDNHSVALTPLGQRLLAGTAELLRMHDKVVDELHGPTVAGRVKLGVPDEYAAHVIRDILPGFSAAWPEVVLDVVTAPSQALAEQAARGRLGCAIVAQPLPAGQGAVVPLAVTQPVWAGAAGWRAGRADILPLALHATACPYRRAMTESLTRAGRRWRIVLSTPSSQAIQACVEAGLGISLLDQARLTPAMRVLEELPRVAPHGVYLLRAPGRAEDPAADRLEQEIRQRFRLG